VADVTADDVTADGAQHGADPTDLQPVRDYLARLDAAGAGLPPDRRAEVLADVREHVRDAVAAATAAGGDAGVAVHEALDRLGPPEEIARAEAEQSGLLTADAATGPVRPGAMERVGEPMAVFLLLLGGFVFVVGWLAGVALLWLSPTWRLREKLLGTFVWPFGYLGVLLVGGLATWTESCTSTATSAGGDELVCTGGPPYPDWVGGVLAVVVLAAPALVAVVLWRRRQAVREGRAS
jgi:hypothetical protein